MKLRLKHFKGQDCFVHLPDRELDSHLVFFIRTLSKENLEFHLEDRLITTHHHNLHPGGLFEGPAAKAEAVECNFLIFILTNHWDLLCIHNHGISKAILLDIKESSPRGKKEGVADVVALAEAVGIVGWEIIVPGFFRTDRTFNHLDSILIFHLI